MIGQRNDVNYTISIYKHVLKYISHYLIAEYVCADSPCQNDGRCVEQNVDYICQCQEGWTGRTCEISKFSEDMGRICEAVYIQV